jgi:threonine dehydratase
MDLFARSYEGGAISLAAIREAAACIGPAARVTPVLTSSSLDADAGRELLFKAEVFQRSGSFKFRGAYNSIASLSVEEHARVVVAHSSGNHAAAVALAAQLLGVPATLICPTTTPTVKRTAVERAGARLVLCEPTMAAREAACAAEAAATGAVVVPPFDSARTICGQGTIALELLEQAGAAGLDAIVVPVSGEFSCVLGRPVEAENVLETNQPTNQPLITDHCPK